MSKRIDLTGMQFGKWIVIKYLGYSNYQCKCECGKIRVII